MAQPGRQVLIKSVAQAIPVFSMSCFRLPRGLCDNITSTIRQFFWGSKQGRRKPSWVAWDILTMPKYLGVLGFRDLEIFNLALLAKQCWRLIENYDSLCARVLRARYYPTDDILNCTLKKGSSFVWQSIFAGIQTFKKGSIWRVGDGTKIDIWEDSWIPNSPPRKVLTRRGNCILTHVSDLIYPISGDWDEQIISDNFWGTDADRILQVPLSHHVLDDAVAWHFTKNGVYNVRSGYYREWEDQFGSKIVDASGQSSTADHPVWKRLWNLKLPGKVKIFIC